MKKIIACLWAAVMCLLLVACGNDAQKDNVESDTSKITTESSQETTASETETPVVDSETEKKYNDTIEWLENYSVYEYEPIFPYKYKYVDSGNTNDIFAYIYEFLETLGDYKESKEYLSRINVLSDKPLRSYAVTIDAFGQETQKNHKTYSYNEHGRTPYSYEAHFRILDLLLGERSYVDAIIERNSDGIITGAEWHEFDLLQCKAKIECDTNGNIVKAHFMHKNGTEWTNTYSYDSKNRMLEANIEYTFAFGVIEDEKHYQYKYAYDDHDNEVLCSIRSYNTNSNKAPDDDGRYQRDYWVSEYTYDEKDNLIKYFKQNADGSRSETEIYSSHKFNEKGQLISVEVTKGEKTFTLFYEYGDYYYYE